MLKDSFKEYFRIWVNVKKSARESGDYSFYKWFLLQTKKELSKVYVKLKDKGWVDLVGQVLKFTTCELKEINIKYKKQNDMSVLEPSKMTNQELLDVYKKGVEWLSKDKETRSEKEEKIWLAGLKRIETIETEMQTRGIVYG